MPEQGAPRKPKRSDRVPPYSEEAERGVLGAALLDPARVLDLCIQARLTLEAFHVRSHQELYQVLLDMNRDNVVIDILTVSDRLRDLGRLSDVGGQEYLEALVDETPVTAHAHHYVDIVSQKFILRRIIEKSRDAIERCYGAEEDAISLLNTTEESIQEISQSRGSEMQPWSVLVKDAMTHIEALYQGEGPPDGIETGYSDLDRKLLGLKRGEMVILAARPSMGKTSLALNIAERVATVHRDDPEQHPVAVFSLEMSSEQLVRRMICGHARVPSHKLSGGYINEVSHADLTQAASALMHAPIYLDDTAGLEALELRSRARRLYRQHKIELIIIDYLQMMNYSQYAREGRQRETAAISGALKGMAKELGVPVLVLSQLSRAPETRDKLAVPKLSDLRDSGSIEQDADVVLLLRRPCKYPNDEMAHDLKLAVLDVAKNRNGPTGEIHLNFEQDFMRFENRAEGVDNIPSEQMEPAEDFEI